MSGGGHDDHAAPAKKKGGFPWGKVLGYGALAILAFLLLMNTSCSLKIGGGGVSVQGGSFSEPTTLRPRFTPRSREQLAAEAYQTLGPIDRQPGVGYYFSETPSPTTEPRGNCTVIGTEQSADGAYTFVRRICPR